MKPIYFIPIFLLIVLNSYSNSRFPLKASSVWKVDHIRNGVSDEKKHESGDYIVKYFLNGDTVLNSIHYFKLFKTGTSYFDTPFYFENVYQGALRDSDNKFLFVGKGESREVLLYDFNAMVDDTIQVPYDDGFQTKVVSSIDTMYDGRRMIHFNPKEPIMGCGDQYYIEGIGGSGGLLEGPACNHFWTNDNHLVCFVQDEILIYHDNNFQFNCDVAKPSDSFLDPTCIWRVDKQYENNNEADFERLVYFISGDTTISGDPYYKLFKSGYQLFLPVGKNYFSGFNDSVYVGAIRETNNKWFFIYKGQSTSKLLYDFNLQSGDIVKGIIYNGDTVKSTGFVLDNRKVTNLSDNYWEKNIMQGVGSDKGLLEAGTENSALICFMKNGASVFHNETGAECFLSYDNLDFYYANSLKVLPGNPNDGDKIKLVVRICYPVDADHPVYPFISSSDYEQEDNSLNVTVTCNYDEKNNSGTNKILVPVYDTIQVGCLHSGNYFATVKVNLFSHGELSDTTIEGDRYLDCGFSVSSTNSINVIDDKHFINVLPGSSANTFIVENSLQNRSIKTINLLTINGQVVDQIVVPVSSEQKAINVNLNGFSKGIYLMQFEGKGINLMKKIAVK